MVIACYIARQESQYKVKADVVVGWRLADNTLGRDILFTKIMPSRDIKKMLNINVLVLLR